jgi:hypothetical protein
MKRLLILISFLLLIPAPAHADSHTIYLATTPNRNYQGEITNQTFEKSLAPDGELGKVIYQPVARPRTWVMDAALIEDVQYLANRNSVLAKNWLDRLKRVLGSDQIYATAYGNPDVTYMQSLAPYEMNFYYQVGLQHLEALLNRNTRSEQGSGYSYKRAKIGSDVREFFNTARQEFINLSTVVNPKEVESDRARIAQLFSPLLSSDQRKALLKNFEAGQAQVISKLRIVDGRYRITSAIQKMPITLVNDFESPVKVDLFFTPLNNRVQFPEYRQITIAAKSKVQVSVPIKTIAAGDVSVIARFENGKGKPIGANGLLDLTSSLISPAVTKFTTGAGIVLILAAVAQSVRRVRRNRKS